MLLKVARANDPNNGAPAKYSTGSIFLVVLSVICIVAIVVIVVLEIYFYFRDRPSGRKVNRGHEMV